jgi:hypothetical protein
MEEKKKIGRPKGSPYKMVTHRLPEPFCSMTSPELRAFLSGQVATPQVTTQEQVKEVIEEAKPERGNLPECYVECYENEKETLTIVRDNMRRAKHNDFMQKRLRNIRQ